MNREVVEIAAGTTNPAKLAAIEQAVTELFGTVRVRAIAVASGVPEQPWGDVQTANGAFIRAQNALAGGEAEYGVGLESGLVEGPGGRLYVVSWAAAVDRNDRVGFGGSERFPVPVDFEPALRSGAELGPLLDQVLDRSGLARREGAVSIFTQGRRRRSEILSIAALHALVALLEPWRPNRSTLEMNEHGERNGNGSA